MPDFSREAAHGGLVAGTDEVGRGPLAGPVIACAVIFLRAPDKMLASYLDDSKKLSAARREQAALALRADTSVVIALAAAPVAEIAAKNILHASLAAMARAVQRLGVRPDLVLVDGNKGLPLDIPCLPVIGGDGKSLSIAAASIIAKVMRDRLMVKLDARYPGYSWAQNAGYPTAVHRAAIAKLGATPHHRMGFGPLRGLKDCLRRPGLRPGPAGG
jgi:ribonuclease HII